MVFLIQHAQNKDSHAIQLKLNEVIAALEGASNRLINVEDMSDDDIQVLHEHYDKLAKIVARDHTVTASHSVEEAEHRSRGKVKQSAKTHKTKPRG
jgi:low affinity Fe/Cu permease